MICKVHNFCCTIFGKSQRDFYQRTGTVVFVLVLDASTDFSHNFSMLLSLPSGQTRRRLILIVVSLPWGPNWAAMCLAVLICKVRFSCAWKIDRLRTHPSTNSGHRHGAAWGRRINGLRSIAWEPYRVWPSAVAQRQAYCVISTPPVSTFVPPCWARVSTCAQPPSH